MEFIACVGVIGFFFLLFAFLLLWRYINYVEIKTLADKGLVKPEKQDNQKGSSNFLTVGIIISGIGLALTLGLLPIGASGERGLFPLGLGPWMMLGYLPLFFGLSLVLVHVLTRNNKKEKDISPQPPEDEEGNKPPED
jgi:hypothetical protein